MVVVRLSRIALRKNVTKPIIHISVTCFLVRISEVMTSKPLWASITSTIVMAPIRKKTIWAVEATDSLSCLSDQRVVAAEHGIDRPQQAGAEQGRGRLVDLDRMFQRDRRVGNDENDDNCGCQHSAPLNCG